MNRSRKVEMLYRYDRLRVTRALNSREMGAEYLVLRYPVAKTMTKLLDFLTALAGHHFDLSPNLENLGV